MKTSKDNFNFEMLMTSNATSHRIEMCMLAILHISAWACLIRSDYNFVFISFCYFVFVNNRDQLVTTVTLGIVIVLTFLDIIFFVLVPRNWLSVDTHNIIWNGLRGLHSFAIFCSVLIFLLKLPLIYLLWNYRKQCLDRLTVNY